MRASTVSMCEGPTRVALQIKRWLIGAVGIGFLGLAVDVFVEHYVGLHSPAQWVPIIFGPPAGAAALVTAWRFEAMTLRLFSMASWSSIAIGGLGLYYHAVAVTRGLGSLRDLGDWQKVLAVLRYAPPLGAPAAFVAMGVLGLLVHSCALKLETILASPVAQGAEHRRPSPVAQGLFGLAFFLLVVTPFIPVLLHRLL